MFSGSVRYLSNPFVCIFDIVLQYTVFCFLFRNYLMNDSRLVRFFFRQVVLSQLQEYYGQVPKRTTYVSSGRSDFSRLTTFCDSRAQARLRSKSHNHCLSLYIYFRYHSNDSCILCRSLPHPHVPELHRLHVAQLL